MYGDVDEDWSLFSSSPPTEDYGLDGIAMEQGNTQPFQSTGGAYIDFLGNELFPPSGECACPQQSTTSILVIDSLLGRKFPFEQFQY